MKNIVTELQDELRKQGHLVKTVRGSEDSLNVWLEEGLSRDPAVTVVYEARDESDFGQFIWGHKWEWNSPTSVGVEEIARRIVHTARAQA